MTDVLPKLFRSMVAIKINSIDNVLDFDFILYFHFLHVLWVVIIFFNDPVSNIIFLEIQNLWTHQHHHLTPLSVHFTTLFMMHNGKQHSSCENSVHFCVWWRKEVLMTIFFLCLLQLPQAGSNWSFCLAQHLYVFLMTELWS